MPYPNEHACRIASPGAFEKGSFIIGRLRGKTTTTTQAFRYPTGDYTVEAARAHCKKQGGSFEAAKKVQEFSDEYGLE